MSVETVLANHGIESHLLPEIMGFVGPQFEVHIGEVKVLQSFLFMRRFERMLGDEEVEWSGYSPAIHVQKLIDMIPKNERKRRIRRMQKIFGSLIDPEPSDEVREAQRAFYTTWVGKNTTCAKIRLVYYDAAERALFVHSRPYTETDDTLETRLLNYKMTMDAAIDILEYYNPPDD